MDGWPRLAGWMDGYVHSCIYTLIKHSPYLSLPLSLSLLSLSTSLCPSLFPSLSLSLSLSLHLSVCRSVFLSVRPSVCASVCLSFCLSVGLSVRRSVCPSVCLSLSSLPLPLPLPLPLSLSLCVHIARMVLSCSSSFRTGSCGFSWAAAILGIERISQRLAGIRIIESSEWKVSGLRGWYLVARSHRLPEALNPPNRSKPLSP